VATVDERAEAVDGESRDELITHEGVAFGRRSCARLSTLRLKALLLDLLRARVDALARTDEEGEADRVVDDDGRVTNEV